MMKMCSDARRFVWCALAAAFLGWSPISAWCVDYVIDPAHSTVGFKVRHLGISKVPGRFAEFEGELSFDSANIAASRAKAFINTASISTENVKRDKHLRDTDFFDVAKFPSISFETTAVRPISATQFHADGTLTMRGVSKPVTLLVSYEGAATDPWGKERAAFSASTTINRRDFGLTWSKVLETGALVVADQVEIQIDVEGTRKG